MAKEIPGEEVTGNGVDCPFMSEQEERELVADAVKSGKWTGPQTDYDTINAISRRNREQNAAEATKNVGR